MIPRCFGEDVRVTLALLNSNGGWTVFFTLRLKMTSWACLVVSRLKFEVEISLNAEVWMLFITENKEVSSAKSFGLVERPSARSLM